MTLPLVRIEPHDAHAASRPRASGGRRALSGLTALALIALGGGIRSAHAQAVDSRDRTALTLRALLDTVGSRHPLVRAAAARLRAAHGSRITAGAFGNPVFGYNVENAPLPGRDAPPMERETMSTVTVPLEPIYQRGAQVRRADAQVSAAVAEAVAERRRVSLDAARAFYRVALAQVAFSASLDLVGWLDSLVVYNRARVEEGVAAESDLIRSEIERDRAAAEATMHESDLARARAELAAFLGDPAGRTGLTVVTDSGPLSLPTIAARPLALPRNVDDHSRLTRDTLLATLVRQSLATRPDVTAARERVSAARAGISTERRMFVRQLGATVGTKQSAGSSSLIAGVSLPLPLLDQNRGERTRAAAERDAAALELESAERSAAADVVGAAEAATLLTDRARQLAAGPRGYLARADEARRIALGAYREGAVPLLQVLDAARAWGEARLTYYQTVFAQHESVFALLVATGRDPSPTASAASGRQP